VARTRVVAADDQTLMLEAVALALEGQDDLELVGTAKSGRELLELVGRVDPHVALVDVRMPGMDGFSCLDTLRERHPSVKVVVLSAVEDERVIQQALRRGASAYVLKGIDPRDLGGAIRQVVERNVHLAPLAREPVPPPELAALSEKEQAVLQALARGLSNREIAGELWLAEQTVKFHLTNIYRKLGVSNRTEAANVAYRHGFTANRPDTRSDA
jgi:DNA-binding NarL/FixJ family response regulator